MDADRLSGVEFDWRILRVAIFLEKRCSLCRYTGSKLFLKGQKCESAKCAFERRSYKPGEHGKTAGRGRRPSGYKERLIEKQKARYIYGLLEKQFKNNVQKAKRQKGVQGENLLILLERRLDNLVYRAGLASSRKEAKQIVSHKRVRLNGKRVSIPSIIINIGDKVEVVDKCRNDVGKERIINNIKLRPTPAWIRSENEWSISVISYPSDIQPSFNVSKIVEYYSR